jgi:RHS repeat-associated protein
LKDINNLGAGSTSGQILSSFSYSYNLTGEIKTWQQQLDNTPSDAKTYSMGYDGDSELQGVTMTAGTNGFDGLTANQSVTYGYDAAGNRTTESTPSHVNAFNTNNLNQLTSITPKPLNISGATNRSASVTVNGQGVTENSSFSYATTLTPANGTSTPLTITEVAANDGTVNAINSTIPNTQPYTYDANGNLIQDEQKTYTWDARNRLVQINFIKSQPATMADNIVMTYDSLDRRVSIIENHGSTILNAKTFVWCWTHLCQQRDITGHTAINQFFAQGEQINGINYFYTFDHLGSVREMTDSAGVVHANYDYDSFGRQTKLSGDLDSDFGYTGFYEEKTAGLDLAWFRVYDFNKGRWLSRDPMGEGIGPNLYNYLENNTLDSFDPFGLCSGSGGGGSPNSPIVAPSGPADPLSPGPLPQYPPPPFEPFWYPPPYLPPSGPADPMPPWNFPPRPFKPWLYRPPPWWAQPVYEDVGDFDWPFAGGYHTEPYNTPPTGVPEVNTTPLQCGPP